MSTNTAGPVAPLRASLAVRVERKHAVEGVAVMGRGRSSSNKCYCCSVFRSGQEQEYDFLLLLGLPDPMSVRSSDWR